MTYVSTYSFLQTSAYGLEATPTSFKSFPSYDDQNIAFTTTTGDMYMLKISNLARNGQSFDVLQLQNAGMLHLEKCGVKCSRVISNILPPPSTISVSDSEGNSSLPYSRYSAWVPHHNQRLARVLSFVPGKLLVDVKQSSELLINIGKYLAQADKAFEVSLSSCEALVFVQLPHDYAFPSMDSTLIVITYCGYCCTLPKLTYLGLVYATLPSLVVLFFLHTLFLVLINHSRVPFLYLYSLLALQSLDYALKCPRDSEWEMGVCSETVRRFMHELPSDKLSVIDPLLSYYEKNIHHTLNDLPFSYVRVFFSTFLSHPCLSLLPRTSSPIYYALTLHVSPSCCYYITIILILDVFSSFLPVLQIHSDANDYNIIVSDDGKTVEVHISICTLINL